METSYIGMFIVAAGVLAFTAHTAYSWGYKIGGNTERLREQDRTVQGVVDYENKRRPKSAKNKRKAARKAVGSISVCV